MHASGQLPTRLGGNVRGGTIGVSATATVGKAHATQRRPPARRETGRLEIRLKHTRSKPDVASLFRSSSAVPPKSALEVPSCP